MKLYYSPGACSLASHAALAEAGLPYTLVKVDLRAKRTEDGEDFTTINPKGYVPALEMDEGGVLTENIAVLSYTADKAGAAGPAEGPEHWRRLETLAFISTELHKNFKPFFNPAASEAERDEAGQVLAKRFRTLSEQLGARPFLFGDAPGIADCYLFVTLRWARKNAVQVPDNLTDLLDRMTARPAVARALQEEGLY